MGGLTASAHIHTIGATMSTARHLSLPTGSTGKPVVCSNQRNEKINATNTSGLLNWFQMAAEEYYFVCYLDLQQTELANGVSGGVTG